MDAFRTKNEANGFTLAEVLITLGIIGVVAALTLPTLNAAVSKKVRAEQIRTVKYKFTKATDKMNSLGLIGPYESTAAFVAVLQQHLKIAKICTASNLRACWPYEKIILNDATELEISKVKTGRQLQMDTNENTDYSSPNVGIVTADGTPMILSYNKKCAALDPVKQYGWTTEDNKPVSNATAGCVAAIYDINGSKLPNKQNADVILFNANGIGNNCAVEIGGDCFTSLFSPQLLTYSECIAVGADFCPSWVDANPYAGVVQKCGGIANVPSAQDLEKIAEFIYSKKPGGGQIYDSQKATEIGFPSDFNFSVYITGGEYYTFHRDTAGHYGQATWPTIQGMCKN